MTNDIDIDECMEYVRNRVSEIHTMKLFGKSFYLTKKAVKEVFILKAGGKLILTCVFGNNENCSGFRVSNQEQFPSK